MLTTWSQNWMRPSGGGGGGLTIAGTARVGQVVTVTNPTPSWPAFVRVMYPGTEAYDQPFLDLDLDNPVPTFTLGEQHMGMMVQVCALELDANGLPTGVTAVSNTIGPVLHAVDPDLEPGAVVVSTPAALATAVAGAAPVIVLAAGTTWNAADIPNTISNKRITTPQNNPARISDSYMAPTEWTNVTWEGIPHWLSFTFLTTVTRSNALNLGPTSSGCTIIAPRVICPNIDQATYQNVPANLLDSIYRGGFGMRFTGLGLSVSSSPGATIRGYFARNVYIALDLNHDTVCEHVRIHGWYFDCVRLIGNAPTGGGRLVGLYVSHCYGLYDEMDTNANAFGNGNAPHPDLIQVFNASSLDFTIDKVAYVIGNTRAHADGCTATGNPVNTNYISNTNVRRMRIRRALFGGSGAITGYFSIADYILDFVSQWSPGLSRGSTGSLRFNESTDQNYQNDGMVSRSLLFTAPATQNLSTSAFITVEDTDSSISGAPSTRVFGSSAIRPDTLSQLALLLRPRPAFATQGAIAGTGHMRPLAAIPTAPTFSVTPTAGGFNVSVTAVSGAESYRLWYRPTGSTGAWGRAVQASTSFVLLDLGSLIGYDLRVSVRTPNGWSAWSPITTATTLTDSAQYPASGVAANITMVQLPAAASSQLTWDALVNYAVPSGATALVVMGNDGTATVTESGNVAWINHGSTVLGTSHRIAQFSWFNDTGVSVNVNLTLTFSAAERATGVLYIIPRSGPTRRIVVAGVVRNTRTVASTTPLGSPIDVAIPRKYLAVQHISLDNAITVTSGPTDYTDLTVTAGGTGSVTTAGVIKFFEASSETPDSWTIGSSVTALVGVVVLYEATL
jgi:hypothetical protein